jgi:hypothetical protein
MSSWFHAQGDGLHAKPEAAIYR